MRDDLDEEDDELVLEAEPIRPGLQTTELWVTVAQLAFAAWALYLGNDDVAMTALAAAGLYPIARAVVKR